MNSELVKRAERVATALVARDQTIGVSESSSGGLISASLLAVPGASRYFIGGAVVYTMTASSAFLRGTVEVPDGMRGASEEFALYKARSVAAKLETTWGIGETGATGPTGNRYGDAAGHSWLAVAGRAERTRLLETGSDDRIANMEEFTASALDLLLECVESS